MMARISNHQFAEDLGEFGLLLETCLDGSGLIYFWKLGPG